MEVTSSRLSQQDQFQRQISTPFASAANLTKNLIGAGIFTLPLALSKASVIPGIIMLACIGSLCGGSYVLIAFMCQTLNCSSYRDMWANSLGRRSAWIVDTLIALNSVMGCLAYIILICDFFEDSIPPLTGWHPSRWQLVVVDTVLFILPLSYMKDLAPLKLSSMAGLLIVAYIFFYLVVDWLLQFELSIDNFKCGLMQSSFGIFFATSVFTGAFQAHYNAPRIYFELGEDLTQHIQVVRRSFGTAFVVYAFFALAGFGMCGNAVEGNILKNYGQAGASLPILLALLGMGFAVTFSYPLVFFSGRNALFSLIPCLGQAKKSCPNAAHIVVTTLMVSFISLISCFVEDVQVVVGLTGTNNGMALCLIIPSLVCLKVAFSPSSTPLQSSTVISKPTIAFATLLLVFGSFSLVIGNLVVLGII